MHLHVAHARLPWVRSWCHGVAVGHLRLHAMVGVRGCHHLALGRTVPAFAIAGLVVYLATESRVVGRCDFQAYQRRDEGPKES